MKEFRKLLKNDLGGIDPLVGYDPKTAFGPFSNQEIFRRGETPSANGNCSARGLAKVAAAMANGGSFQGVTVLGPKGWEAMHAKPTLGQLGFGSSDELYFTQ